MSNFLRKQTVFFPGQQPNERIYLITRQHWIILARNLFVWVLFVALLFFFDYFVLPPDSFVIDTNYESMIAVIKNLYTMFLLASLFTIWALYYLNYQIVTNERVVDIDQKNIFFNITSELHIANLEDVSIEVKGIGATLFNYGNVYIQTAGAKRNFEFDNIPHPEAVAKLILDLYEQLPAGQKYHHHQPGKRNP